MLNKEILKASLENILANTDPEKSVRDVASALADAIDTYIKGATITVQVGIPVTVVCPAGTGATTGPGSGTIS